MDLFSTIPINSIVGIITDSSDGYICNIYFKKNNIISDCDLLLKEERISSVIEAQLICIKATSLIPDVKGIPEYHVIDRRGGMEYIMSMTPIDRNLVRSSCGKGEISEDWQFIPNDEPLVLGPHSKVQVLKVCVKSPLDDERE